MLYHSVSQFAIGWDRESVDLDDLSEINVPRVFIGKPDVGNFKVSARSAGRGDLESPDINHAHVAER
ncbi:MAG: hypothetical protein ACLQFR_16560 [Streptosporangiaceae bacterium]